MVWQFVDVFKKVGHDTIRDDDFADRLSHRHTVVILVIFFLVVGSSQFVGNKISCWVPAHFSGAMTSYTNEICWIANSYYVNMNDRLPGPDEPRQYRINYYQWVPFILAISAFFFYLPFAFWHVLSTPNALQARSIMKIIKGMDQGNTDAREKSIRTICKIIERSVEYNRERNYSCFGRLRRCINSFCIPIQRHSGCYVSVIYMITKCLYMVNCVGQFFLLNAFMGNKFNLYGFDVMRDVWYGKDFWESPQFPRVTMCDFIVRSLGENNQKNTIQCVLPINLFNEKIFMFLWFWYVFVAIVSCYNFLSWLPNFFGTQRSAFVRGYVRANDRALSYGGSANLIETKMFESFIYDYLRQDGVFLLRLIKKNTNDLVVGELIYGLWDQFKRSPKYLHSADDSMNKENSEKLVSSSGEHMYPNVYQPNV